VKKNGTDIQDPSVLARFEKGNRGILSNREKKCCASHELASRRTKRESRTVLVREKSAARYSKKRRRGSKSRLAYLLVSESGEKRCPILRNTRREGKKMGETIALEEARNEK